MEKEYILMNKNTPVLKMRMEDGIIFSVSELYDLAYLPVNVSNDPAFLKRSLHSWWSNRSIPASREKVFDGLDNLGMSSEIVPPELLEKCFGLSLSDQYWIKPFGTELTWEAINFFDNDFSDDMGKALFDDMVIENPDFISPDNTSEGCLKKKWKIIDGERCLIKAGGRPFLQQPYNEIIASAICRRLEIENYVDYQFGIEKNEPVSICKNFITRDTELVSAYAITKSQKQPSHISAYQHYVNLCREKGIDDICDRLDEMLFIDHIIRNEDRHYRNFGLIRNVETLEYVGVAPIFDSGSSLLYNTSTEQIKKECITHKSQTKPFTNTHDQSIDLICCPERFEFSKLYGIEEEAAEIFNKGGFLSNERISALCYAISERVGKLDRFLSNRRPQIQISTIQQTSSTDDIAEDDEDCDMEM